MNYTRISISRFLALLCVLVPGLMGGCLKRKINSVTPVIQNTVRVSLTSSNSDGNLDCVPDPPGISRDGRFIAFTSKAFNLVPNDTNNAADVFYRDMLNRTTTLVSVNLTGTATANAASGTPSMSANGQYVVFASLATDLTTDVVPAGKQQIFVRDMFAGTTTLVSRASGPGPTSAVANDICSNPRISADGSTIVFDSLATNLDTLNDGSDALIDIYARAWLDVADNFPTTLISFASTHNSGPANKGNGSSTNPCVSATGRYIAFTSAATNLVSVSADGSPDNNFALDVFVRDTQTFRTVRCSVPFAGAPADANHDSKSACISADGQLVAFRSVSPVLHPNAQETNPNIYIRSWNAAIPFTEVLSVHTSGATGGASCDLPTMSEDGTRIVWQSQSSALVNGDSNGVSDVFLRDRVLLQTTRQSVSTFGNELNGPSNVPTYSGDGRYIVFYSDATNVVDDDFNGASDIFLRGPPFK